MFHVKKVCTKTFGINERKNFFRWFKSAGLIYRGGLIFEGLIIKVKFHQFHKFHQ